MIEQKTLRLNYPRGYHLITHKIEEAFTGFPEKGLLNILVQHTSAGITLNENADPSVRQDFRTFIDDMVPEAYGKFRHTLEGSDDMPAHLKSSLIGTSLNIPITGHKLNLGTWQGVYFCEFRDHGGTRNIILTVYS